MTKLNPVLFFAFSLLLTLSAQAEQHMSHVKASKLKGCDSPVATMHCAKTITSVFDQNDRLWSAWTNKSFLFVNYSDDYGRTFSKPVQVNAIAEKISARNEHRPKIKVANNGNIYLSWTTKLSKRFTGNIRFSKSTDGGISFSSPVTINDDAQIISHRFDAMAVNKQGDIFLSWLDKREQKKARDNQQEYNGAAAYYAFSSDDGKTFSRNIKLADNSCECCRMAIATDNRELPVVLWRHIYGDNIRDHSLASFKDKRTPMQPVRVSYDHWKIKGCPHHGPSLSIDPENRYHAVWFNNGKERYGIFYGRSDDNGKTFSNIRSVGQHSKHASHADIISTGKKIYITWREFHKPENKVFLMVSNDSGNSWSTPGIIASTSHKNDYPFLLKNGDKVILSWQIPGHQYLLMPIKN